MKMKTCYYTFSKKIALFCVLTSLSLLGWSQTTINEDFTSPVADNGFSIYSDIDTATGTGVTFDTSGSGSMRINFRYQADGSSENPFAAMSRAFTGNAGNNWTMSANFDISGLSFSNSAAGLTAMAANANLGGSFYSTLGTGYKALVGVDFDDQMDLIILDSGGTVLATLNIGAVPSGSRTLNFTGTYAGNGDLTLFTSLLDGATELGSVSHVVAAASVASGDYFGTYMGKRWSGNPATVIYNSTEISVVPEPAIASLLTAVAVMAVVVFRRKATKK